MCTDYLEAKNSREGGVGGGAQQGMQNKRLKNKTETGSGGSEAGEVSICMPVPFSFFPTVSKFHFCDPFPSLPKAPVAEHKRKRQNQQKEKIGTKANSPGTLKKMIFV